MKIVHLLFVDDKFSSTFSPTYDVASTYAVASTYNVAGSYDIPSTLNMFFVVAEIVQNYC